MLKTIHAEMTQTALETRMSPRALKIIISANLGQDAFSGQVGHDEYHFDNNAFDKANAYLQAQRETLRTALPAANLPLAWSAFGRLTHAVQDFYSHSNYVSMWLAEHADAPPAPAEIDPLRKDLLESPRLHSGRVCLPWDAVYFIPGLRGLALKFLPEDSHGKMNLDSPKQGTKFAYARAAAIKRTVYEFDYVAKGLSAELVRKFSDVE
ncbi:MAG: hypothetical protein LC108_00420 [Anaerolineales bacterium]|nr:hypothetical protein [Anaerolineales bacterium]